MLKTLNKAHKFSSEDRIVEGREGSNDYWITCSCGWKSPGTFGGDWPKDNEPPLEMLEKILHLVGQVKV
jgi:hypothetical protein